MGEGRGVGVGVGVHNRFGCLRGGGGGGIYDIRIYEYMIYITLGIKWVKI